MNEDERNPCNLSLIIIIIILHTAGHGYRLRRGFKSQSTQCGLETTRFFKGCEFSFFRFHHVVHIQSIAAEHSQIRVVVILISKPRLL